MGGVKQLFYSAQEIVVYRATPAEIGPRDQSYSQSKYQLIIKRKF